MTASEVVISNQLLVVIEQRPYELDSRPNPELGEDVPEMTVDRVDGQEQLFRDGPAPLSFGHPPRHGDLGVGQTFPARGGAGHRRRALDDPDLAEGLTNSARLSEDVPSAVEVR